MTEINPTVDQVLRNLDEKRKTHDELMRQLKVSLAIQKLVPDAFKDGPCSIGGKSAHDFSKWEVKITRRDGTYVTFSAIDVPFELWPVGMQVEFVENPAYRRLHTKLKRID